MSIRMGRPVAATLRRSSRLGAPWLAVAPWLALAQDPSAARHVDAARRLVQGLALEHTNYEHGQGSIRWDGTLASHTDCSGFIDHLLMQDDGYDVADFKRWFRSRRPTAARDHDVIEQGRGLPTIRNVGAMRPGDPSPSNTSRDRPIHSRIQALRTQA